MSNRELGTELMTGRNGEQDRTPHSTVFIVDAHEAVREGLRAQIDSHAEFTVAATAATVRESLDASSEAFFDLAVVDEQLPDGTGLALCRVLIEGGVVGHCILHAGTGIDPDDAMALGVSAVVLKQLSGTDLIDALQRLSTVDAMTDLQRST